MLSIIFHFILLSFCWSSTYAEIDDGTTIHTGKAAYNKVSQILSQMDHSAIPCENFYKFACGGESPLELDRDEEVFLKLHKISNTSSKYLRDFKTFYYSCIDYELEYDYNKRIEGVKKMLGEIEIIGEIDLTSLFAKLILRQSLPFLDIGISIDEHSSKLNLKLTLPKYRLENWSGLSVYKNHCLEKNKFLFFESDVNMTKIYHSYFECSRNYSNYLDLVFGTVKELHEKKNLTADFCLSPNNYTEIIKLFELLPLPAEQVEVYNNVYYPSRNILYLQENYSILNWTNFLEILTGKQIDDDVVIQIYFEEYFKKLFEQLARIGKTKISKTFMAIHAHDLYTNTVIEKQKSNRDSFCITSSKILLPDVWAYFNKERIQDDQKKTITNLFDLLKSNLCKSFSDIQWTEQESKSSIENKCKKIELQLYESLDSASLENNYKNVIITNDYQTNLIKLLINARQNVFYLYGYTISPGILFSHLFDPILDDSVIFLPNTITASVSLFKKNYIGIPKYIIMGNIGFHLAYQMARLFSPPIINKLLSTPSTSYSSFISQMKTMMDYSSPKFLQNRNISFNLNGSLSIISRTVENTAFRLVSDSLKIERNDAKLPFITPKYSEEKIFLVTVAQEICKKTTINDFMLKVFEQSTLPPVLRVENMMGNSEKFSEVFSCGIGSGMSFAEKRQFPYLPKQNDEKNPEDYDEYDGYEEEIEVPE